MNDGGCLNSDVSLGQQLLLREKQTMSHGRGDKDSAGSVCALGLRWPACGIHVDRPGEGIILITRIYILRGMWEENLLIYLFNLEVWIFVLVYVDLCFKRIECHPQVSIFWISFSLLLSLCVRGFFPPYMSQWTVYSSVILANVTEILGLGRFGRQLFLTRKSCPMVSDAQCR